MQVATLFRESATLLGASMEAGGGGAPDPAAGALTFDTFNHPAAAAAVVAAANKYKLNMKLEPQDDGYETSADMLLSNTANSNEIKCEQLEDPYSFIDEDPLSMLPTNQGMMHCIPTSITPPTALMPGPKKRGRKKKIKTETGPEYPLALNGNARPLIKERKKHDRFNGMPEEEVSKRTLPDHLTPNLDIIIIGINPGLFAAYKGHHYAGPGNHFWKCLYLSGLTPEQMTADEDFKLLQVGIGFTNMVQRATKGSADLTRKEIKEGSQILLEKLQRYKPKIAVFNGKLIYEVFSGKKDFNFGRQPDLVDGTNTYMWVMPSSSARCAQLPRAADKVPFYAALKKFRDYLNGIVTSIDDSEVVFSETRLKTCYEQAHEAKNESQYSMEIMDISNAVAKKEDVPCKKKRGRPKKIKVEGEEPTKPIVRKAPSNQNANNCDFPKKKRGRPKKIKSEDTDLPLVENNTSTNISKCFSSPSPIQSPTAFYHMTPALTPPSSSSSLYAPQPPAPYSQSPRPHSQPFTHSDLSSEISAAISSEQLGSPASPSLGPPDFEPPTSMAEEPVECRFSSPAPSNASEQQHFPNYHTFGVENDANNYSTRLSAQDVTSKSLSGLESLVDQIPSIAEGETLANVEGDQYGQFPPYGSLTATRASPAPHYGYSPTQGYGSLPLSAGYPSTGGWSAHHPFSEPVPLAYPQLPYSQQFPPSYGPSLHVPSPNYPPYYNTYAPQQTHPSHPHPGYHMFDRIKPDIGYGGF